MEKQKTKNEMFYPEHLKESLSKAIEINLPALLIGDTGTGKTGFLYDLAKENKEELIRINLTGQTGVDELIGKYLANQEGTYWIDGLLTIAMKQGKWIVLDEINMALPEILAKLHSLLDDDCKIVLNEKEGEVVTPHKNFRFFATMNPSEEYAGTKELNKAFLSRFPVILNVNYSPKEVDIIVNRTGLDEKVAANLVALANEIRNAKRNDTISYSCSTRDLIHCATLITEGIDFSVAIEISMINKAPIEEKNALQKMTSIITGEGIIAGKEKFESVLSLVEKHKKLKKDSRELIETLTKDKELLSEKLSKMGPSGKRIINQKMAKCYLDTQLAEAKVECIRNIYKGKTGKNIRVEISKRKGGCFANGDSVIVTDDRYYNAIGIGSTGVVEGGSKEWTGVTFSTIFRKDKDYIKESNNSYTSIIYKYKHNIRTQDLVKIK